MSLFDSFIKDAINAGTFLDINRAGFESDVIFGIIFQESETFLCLKKFDENGEYDGVVVIRKNDITYIGIGGNKRVATEKLVMNRRDIESEITVNLTSMISVIKSISSKFGYLAIYEEDYSEDFYLGEVLDIDDEFVFLNEYGTRKSLDRSKILLRLNSITRIEVDGRYEKSILQTFSSVSSAEG
jgi:hypothetical protein